MARAAAFGLVLLFVGTMGQLEAPVTCGPLQVIKASLRDLSMEGVLERLEKRRLERMDFINHDPHERTFKHRDESGNEYLFEWCYPGKVLDDPLSCPPDSAPGDIHVPSCRNLEKGKEMMPFHNLCQEGIPCKTCPDPWTTVTKCNSFSGMDTECRCEGPENYLDSAGDCRPVPICDAGFEPRNISNKEGYELQCKPCLPGYFQPNNSSTNSCRPHQVCESPKADVPCPQENEEPPSEGPPYQVPVGIQGLIIQQVVEYIWSSTLRYLLRIVCIHAQIALQFLLHH